MMPSTSDQTAAGKGWLLLAITAMGLSTLFAVVLVLSRIPLFAPWAPVADLFHRALVLHVDFAIGIWFLAFGGFFWARSLGGKAGGWSQGLAALGMLLMIVSAFGEDSPAVLSDYLPVLDNRGYLLGLGLFGCAWLGLALRVQLSFLRSRQILGLPEDGTVIIPLTALLSLLAVLALLLGMAGLPAGDWQLNFAALVWGPGHLLQSVHTLFVLLAWAWLCQLAGVRVRINRVTRNAMILLVALPAIAGGLLLPWLEFGSGVQHLGYTLLMALGGGMAFMVVVVGLLRFSVEGKTNEYRTLLCFSLLLFAVGVSLGFFIRENTSWVPAHYHGVIGAVTLAFMGLIYYLLPVYGAQPVASRLIRWQSSVYGGGLLLLIAGLVLSDIPRKISGAQMQVQGLLGNAGVLLMGLGGVAALTGSFWFLLLAVKSLLAGRTSYTRPDVLNEAEC